MLLFLDTETTGLPTRRGALPSELSVWPRVVQVAWILADERGRLLESSDYIVRPRGFEIPSQAAQIHGITTARARAEGVGIASVLRKFEAAVRRSATIVAHNTDFDLNVIMAELIRAKVRTHIERKHSVCTMRIATNFCRIPRRRFGGYKWPTLAELHLALFRQAPQSPHNAAWDVRACMKSYFALRKLGVI